MKAILGTRKGILILSEKASGWSLDKVHFDGVKVSYGTYDKNTGAMWAGVNHGHWGPKLHVSNDGGQTFQELATPKFPESSGETLKDFWAIESDKSGRIYVGTEPAALFYSDDKGQSWHFLEGMAKMPGKKDWMGGGNDASCLHSVIIDPNDQNHIQCGISCAGMITTKDRGRTWTYSNKGMKAYFLPNPDADVGQDPHRTKSSLSDPKIMWQQNHCGIFKSEDGGQSWIDLSKNKGVASAFGWGIAIDEKDPNIAYTVPALSDETRVPVDKKLVVQKTVDGGKSWKVITKGLPQENCYDICYRHALSNRGDSLLFGTTTGNLYYSSDKGESWKNIGHHFPPIYSTELI